MSSFGENLKKARIAAGYTQQQMADRFNVTRGAVAQWESGAVYPETSKLPEIAVYLKCSVDSLFALAAQEAEPEGSPKPAPISKYWMVHGIGQRSPSYQHWSVSSAVTEAKRLATANPGITFAVLETVEAFQAERPCIHTLGVTETDDIPF